MAARIKHTVSALRFCPNNDANVFFTDSVDFWAKVDII